MPNSYLKVFWTAVVKPICFAITGVPSSYSSSLSKSVIINTKSLKFKYKRHQGRISKQKMRNI